MRTSTFALILLLQLMSGPLLSRSALIAQDPNQGQEEVERPLTKAQTLASARILSTLKKNRSYSNLNFDCLFLDFDQESEGRIEFTLRFDHRKCGGTAPSNLIDRFAVHQKTRSILYYDVANDRYESFAWFLKHHKW